MRMNLCPTDEGHSDIAFTGFYELEISERFAEHARQGGLLIDVGANYGYFSLLWAAAASGNRVMAFEASSRNYAALMRNVALNGLGSQIEILGMAVGREEGTLPFFLGPREQTGWGGFSPSGCEATIQVSVVTLDSRLVQSQIIEVLKIDVEGADTWVLYGAKNLLETKRIKHIYFEQHKRRMKRLGILESEAPDFLRKVGYTVRPLYDPNSVVVEYYAMPAV
jgi:FkbM family methyltransferase